jgi:hypothetical protein
MRDRSGALDRPGHLLVLEDFGPRLGQAWRETDAEATDRETLIRNLMDGHIGMRYASSPSIPPRAGRARSPRTSPTSCAGA